MQRKSIVRAKVKKSELKVIISKMNSGKNGKHYLGKPLFCAKEIPKTEGMGILPRFGTNVIFSHLQPCSQNEYNTSSNRNGITRAQFQDKNGQRVLK